MIEIYMKSSTRNGFSREERVRILQIRRTRSTAKSSPLCPWSSQSNADDRTCVIRACAAVANISHEAHADS